ncbi:hypothetical protein VTK56DRAFT_9920 [Thermocarpiscus australiensis]
MPRLRRNRYLTCFYCGRKTSTLYDGRTRRFECPSCDATNYLDENGDITDPPVATDKEATPARQYAVPRAVPPPSSPRNSTAIFCATCLKNQHLLSASLAQYLPDPDDPDYAEREKSLYRFRKNQERLYPQICADCEPKVRQRLEQAAYTAKTDLLRRMLDRSASMRKTVKTRGWLELVDTAGRWLWIAGLVLQLAWHAVVVHALLSQDLWWAGGDSSLFTFRLLRICAPLVTGLPSAERLLRWSTVASVLGIWWNPRFAQIYRGFTRHISGVSKWYIYQAVTVVIRVCLQRVWDLTDPDPLLLNMQTAGHAFAAGFALLVFILAPRAIQINMAPLFGPSSRPLRLHDPPEQSARPDETKSMAELLDEISRSPTSPTPPSPIDDEPPSFPRHSTATSPPMGHAHALAAQTFTSSLQQIDSLRLSSSSSSYSHHAPDEMDWSPTPSTAETLLKSKHRAFNTQGQRASQPFGAAPTEPHRGPFWYRVPPAPTTPAQRLFNPPNRPGLRVSPVGVGVGVGVGGKRKEQGRLGQEEVMRFRGRDNSNGTTTLVREGGESDESQVKRQQQQQQQVTFAEPRLFADAVVGAAKNDPRNELSGMWEEFKLDGGEEKDRGGGWFRFWGGGSGGGGKGRKKR